MIRKSLLSIVGGIVIGLALSFGGGANAACNGNCSNGGPQGDGCTTTYEGCTCVMRCPTYPEGPCTQVCTCVYSLDCGPAPEEPPVS
jgi:hypothetical protein